MRSIFIPPLAIFDLGMLHHDLTLFQDLAIAMGWMQAGRQQVLLGSFFPTLPVLTPYVMGIGLLLLLWLGSMGLRLLPKD